MASWREEGREQRQVESNQRNHINCIEKELPSARGTSTSYINMWQGKRTRRELERMPVGYVHGLADDQALGRTWWVGR